MGNLLQFTQATNLAGDWVGSMTFAKTAVPLRLHFEVDEDHVSGTITIPSEHLIDKTLNVGFDSSKIHFDLETPSGLMQFNGSLSENSITGTLTQKDIQGTFQIFHLFPVDPKKYFGIYELKPKQHIYIRTWDELGENQLTFFDDSGAVGPLYPSTETSFFAGSGLWIPLPPRAQVTFRKDPAGHIEGLTWTERGQSQRFAKKILPYKEEEVTFRNGSIELSGSLVTPAAKGPHPTLVLVHGSGPVTRDFFGPISYIFARNGIAVLSYDKRGIGKSGGHWLDQSFEDLASDALVGLNFLKNREEIDPMKIGLWGISQGGWIVPLAASQSKDIAFAMILSAAAVTPAEQNLMAMDAEMRVQKVPEEKIKESLVEMKAQVESLSSEEARTEFETQVEKLKAEGNEKLLASSGIENPRFLLFFRRIMNFQPLPHLEKLKRPVLAIYGEFDRTVPVQGNKEKLEKALKKNRDVTIYVFPKGDHALMLSETGSMQEYFNLNQFVPGLFELMVQWIQDNTRPIHDR